MASAQGCEVVDASNEQADRQSGNSESEIGLNRENGPIFGAKNEESPQATTSTAADLEELFKDRYTERDPDYAEAVSVGFTEPPTVFPWYGRPKRSFDYTNRDRPGQKRRPYEDQRDSGRGGGYKRKHWDSRQEERREREDSRYSSDWKHPRVDTDSPKSQEHSHQKHHRH